MLLLVLLGYRWLPRLLPNGLLWSRFPDIRHFVGVGRLLGAVMRMEVPGGPVFRVIATVRDADDGPVPGP